MFQDLNSDLLGELVNNCDYETIKSLMRANKELNVKLEKLESVIDLKKVQHVKRRLFELVNEMFPLECEMEYNTANSYMRCWLADDDKIDTNERYWYKSKDVIKTYYVDGKALSKEEYKEELKKDSHGSGSDEEFDPTWSDEEEQKFKEDGSYTISEFNDRFEKEFDSIIRIMLKQFGSKKKFRNTLNELYLDIMKCDGIEFDTHTIYPDKMDWDDEEEKEYDENGLDPNIHRYTYYKYKNEIPADMDQEEINKFLADKFYNATWEEEEIFSDYEDMLSIGMHEYKKPWKPERKRLQIDINVAEVIESYR